jgi:hypothetical protein
MIARRPLAALAALVVVASLGCSDSTSPRGHLSQDEMNMLALELGVTSTSTLPATASADRIVAESNTVPAPVSLTVDITAPCPKGGQKHVKGSLNATIDGVTKSVVADLSSELTPQDCGFQTKEGVTVRVSGDPNLTSTAHVETQNGLPVGVHTATTKGGFTWSTSDGRHGSCTVDYSATADYTNNKANLNGSFCGSTITFSGPLHIN